MWATPGSTVTAVDWAITSTPFGGFTYASGVGAATTQELLLSSNVDGYAVDNVNVSIPSLDLGAGTYWLLLENVVVSDGTHVYWDQSDGPSAAYGSNVGDLANLSTCGPEFSLSETFQITGAPSLAIPEPASCVLAGLGLLGMSELLRRKMKRKSA